MSVIIKGMKMPQACWCCPITKCEHCQHFYAKSRPTNCPLIELPPHGDLVDVDELLKKKWPVLWNGESFYVVNADDLIEAPTIMEEENGV